MKMENIGTENGFTTNEQSVIQVFSIHRRLTEAYVRALCGLSKSATFEALNNLRLKGTLKRLPTQYVPNIRTIDTYELV